MSELYYDLTPQEKPVSIDGKRYVLREPSEGAISEWENFQLKQTKLVDGKVSGIGDMSNSRALLISKCLYTTNGEGKLHQQVSLDVIKGWPSRITKPLFQECKTLAGLDEIVAERKAINAAFNNPESPVSYDILQGYVADLASRDEKKYKCLVELFKPIDEDESARPT